MPTEAFIINPKDNVATLFLERGNPNTKLKVPLDGRDVEVTLREEVPYGHKFAIRPIRQGEQVIKYGYSIGAATVDIEPGQHVHIHNTESNRGRGDLAAKKSGEGRK